MLSIHSMQKCYINRNRLIDFCELHELQRSELKKTRENGLGVIQKLRGPF